MKNEQLILTKEDYLFLIDCYFSGRLYAFNRARLLQELRNAKVVNSEYVPSNVVRSNSDVLVGNLDKCQTFNIHIVSPDRKRRKPNDIPASDPLAVALLGYQTGAITEWELSDGVNRFQVVSVHQPETDPVADHFMASSV